jgi:hypothetical protein
MRQSFIVDITPQQNASWQGTVTGVNENKTVAFRSALELIRLIDTTLESEEKGERTGKFP